MMKTLTFVLPGVLFLLVACGVRPGGPFDEARVPPRPDYGDEKMWAALPGRVDSADVVPDKTYVDLQDSARVDVFFIYPTTYVGSKGQDCWNADVSDAELNVRTDKSAIRNQASVFNGSCRIYAPRYRQAHLECFYTRQQDDAKQALALAYEDVREAFKFYLAEYNAGRPLIIAAHSQGTYHAVRLLQEFYQGDAAMPDLIAAYLIGMPVEKNAFVGIPPCTDAEDTHCFCSWRTVNEKYRPSKYYPTGTQYAITNPLTWSDSVAVGSRQLHEGAVLRKFYDGLYPSLMDVRVDNGLLRVTRPKIPGVPFLPTRNYHIADYNFFYANLRKNVEERIGAYFRENRESWENQENR